ncbi:MAG TPA: translocation/assembly module TamB domain-containing protein [Polyangiaceae bacterium]|nr:translocation/assembly module TamB domain-containing protein [Polyangiaceae bacterium]
MHPLRPSKHWAAHVLAAIALAAVFVGAAAAGLLLHADLPVSRRVAARIAEDALRGTLRGRIAIAPLDSVNFTHVAVAQATLFDTYGEPVLEVQRVRIDMSLRGLLTDFLFGATTGGIVVNHVEVHRAIVTLRADPKTGEPTLVAAFAPAPRSGAKPPSGNGPEVLLPSIEVGEGIVRSRLPALPHFRARLRSVQGAVRGGPSGIAVDVHRFGLSLRQADRDARGTGTFALRAPGPVQSTFEGFVGDVEVRAAAALDGTHVDVTADAPRVRPAAARRLLPDWPLTQTATAHAELRGDLPNLTVRWRATVGQGSLAADGPLVVHEGAHAKLALQGEHLDARAFVAGAPATDVSFSGTADVTSDGERVAADAALHSSSSTLEGAPLPAVDATAALADGSVKGILQIHEPGIPVQASFELHPSLALDVDAQTGELSLASIERISARGLRGNGRARAHAHLEGGTLHASLDGDFGGVAMAGRVLGQARLHVDAAGPIGNPEKLRGTARLEASSVKFASLDLDHVVVEARGSPALLDFDATLARTEGPTLKAAGQARLTPRPLLEKTRVELEQGPVHVEGDVASLDLDQGTADIENVRVAGAGGTITGSVRIAPKLLELTAEGEGVNLDTLSRALGLPRGEAAGTLRLSTDLVIGRDVTRGHVAIGLGDATLHTVAGLSLQLSADLDDRHLTGSASGLVAGVGTFGTTFDTELGGTPLDLASWENATGGGEVQIGDVHLGLLSAVLPKESPVDAVEGLGFARILLERKTAQAPLPSVFATVSTRGLAASLRSSNAKPLRISGIDLTATGQFDAPTGQSTGTTLAADAHGDLFTATGTVRVDVPRFLKEPARALAQLVDTPVDVVLTMPKRDVTALPEPLRDPDLAGSVSGMASLRGTLAHPTLFVSVQGHDLAAARAGGRPIDVHGDAQYEWATRAVAVRASAAVAGRDVGTLTVRGDLPSGPESFRGSARLAFDALPIDALGAAGAHGMSGSIDGTASLSRDENGGSLDADLRIQDTFVEHTSIGQGELHVSTSGPVANAKLSFRGARDALDATGSAPLEWRGPLPSLGASAPVRAHVTMHDFAAAALTPATAAVLSRLGGRLDADLNVELIPSPRGGGLGFTGGIDGTASLRDGSVLIDALGLQVNDITATAQARRGEGAITNISIRDMLGKVRSSSPNLRGTADIVLDGVRVTHGTAELDTDNMPILFRGAPQGRITGRADARLTRQPGRMQVDVELPKLTVLLPQSSTRDVQQLGDNPDVTIVQLEQTGPPEPVAMPWRLALHLGNAVNLRRADVDLRLTGSPVLDLGEEAVASGTIDLVAGGRIPVLGKVFSVDDGKVVFDTGDPSNPHVVVHANTRASNDSMVYVEVTGTMRDAKIALRSDPPLPEAEVFALLVGGSAPDSGDATSGSQANAGGGAGAVALGTGVSMGVNQLVANSPVEVRVDTTEQNRPRYTAAVRIRENLWFEAQEYQQDEYGAESTTRNVVSGTVDYRFARQWSLRTQAGNAGGALDLLWQYRY